MKPLRTVLLVDDNPDDRLLIARRVAEQLPEVEVRHVPDAAALEQALAEGGFDVMVTDYQLRWSTGTEVLRRCKQRFPGTPVIMFTASGSEEVAVEAMKNGLDDYITKTAKHYARVPYAILACHERAAQRAKLEELLESLRQRQRELERADEQKNRFLATLAHELRNPLAPVRYAAELLKDDVPVEVIRRVRDILKRQTRHMARLLDDLLDIGRITQDRMTLVMQPLDLRAIARFAFENVETLMAASGHAFEMSLPDEPLRVQGDEVRLTQVLTNLLDNAVKFSPAGSRITLTLKRSGDVAEMSVRDAGVGIPPGALDAVFDMFSPLSAGRLGGVSTGLGIGLALVRELVRLHGGSVRASSDGVGKGACFTVSLPLLGEAGGAGGEGPA
jgi:signal transduction histidine kinase